jgi:hypothetical protein
MNALSNDVTLVVSEWWGVQPGAVAFACPDLPTARTVVRALRNAVEWFVVDGQRSLEDALAAERRDEVLLRSATSSIPPPAPAMLAQALGT